MPSRCVAQIGVMLLESCRRAPPAERAGACWPLSEESDRLASAHRVVKGMNSPRNPGLENWMLN